MYLFSKLITIISRYYFNIFSSQKNNFIEINHHMSPIVERKKEMEAENEVFLAILPTKEKTILSSGSQMYNLTVY